MNANDLEVADRSSATSFFVRQRFASRLPSLQSLASGLNEWIMGGA